MSDSVTNVQIEDVLSSIRKLVSEEVRAQTREVPAPAVRPDRAQARGTQDPAPDDRLLLTPALRVQPDAETGQDDADEAPFTHAEAETEEADLLDLMARVRAAGARQAEVEARRPKGIAAVERPKPKEEMGPATEAAIRSALVALGGGDRDAFDPKDDTADSLADDLARLEAEDTLDFAGRDDRLKHAPDEHRDAAEASDDATVADVPRFLHRNGITSLGQRIAEVESVVSTSGGEWEPEVGEEAEASPVPQAGGLPWDEAAPEEEAPMASFDDSAFDEDGSDSDAMADDVLAEDVTAGDDDWSVAPDPVERDFQERPTPRLHLTEPRRVPEPEDIVSADEDEEEAVVLAVADTDAAEDMTSFDDEDFEEAPFADHTADEDDLPELGAYGELRVETDIAAFRKEPPLRAAPDPKPEPRPEPVAAAPVEDIADEAEVGSDVESYVYEDQTALTEDTTLFDEEMLRDLVSEIVRQELQGALGERITRNVRKLVRREIHRALSAQDLH